MDIATTCGCRILLALVALLFAPKTIAEPLATRSLEMPGGSGSPQAVRTATHYRTWSVYNGGPDSIHYSRLSQITPANVSQLRPAWTHETGDAFAGAEAWLSSEFECNPIVVGKVLYAVTPKMRVIALDAGNGALLWSFNPLEGIAGAGVKRRMRGVTYWAEGDGQRIFAVANQFLYALDARNGAPIRSFGVDGRVDLRQGLGRDPEQLWVSYYTPGIVYRDLIIMGSTGSAPGDIRAFDVRTGAMRWTFHTIPHPGEFGHDTWPADAWKNANGANSWAGMALDEKRGLVFVPTASGGEGTKDYYGADRVGDNLFANTLLALDAATGKRVWHYQVVRHDLWDRDLPAPPSLVTVRRAGRSIDAVAQITKSGWVFVFDRETGKPLFPIAERRYLPSRLAAEQASPTQPLPLLPEPFARQELTRDMLTRRTPQAHAAVAAEFDKLLSAGQYVPPEENGAILMPGIDGGGNWGGTAFDPQTGLLYVNASEAAWVLKMKQRPARMSGAPASGKSLYIENCAGCHKADKSGSPPQIASLLGAKGRLAKLDTLLIVFQGSGRMPSFAPLGKDAINAIVDYVLYDIDHPAERTWSYGRPGLDLSNYVTDEFKKFLDPDGYPAMRPPWGTLSAIDLNTGNYAWRLPLGEYPELAAQGIKNTGSDNFGGAVVTENGLLFIAATVYDRKLRAFDKRTGRLLWETTLPAAATATPALYEVDGREFLVLAAGGGKDGRTKPGGSIIAFALPVK